MRKLIALALALVALAACRTESHEETALACNPQRVKCHLRYVVWPQAPHGMAVALPPTLLAVETAIVPAPQGVVGAANEVELGIDAEHPEEADVGEVAASVVAAARAGRWWLVGTLLTFLSILGLRKFAPVGSKLERWLHTPTGLWAWIFVLSVTGKVAWDLWQLGAVDLKTFGGIVGTVAVTKLLQMLKDSAPTPAAQAVAAAKAGAGPLP